MHIARNSDHMRCIPFIAGVQMILILSRDTVTQTTLLYVNSRYVSNSEVEYPRNCDPMCRQTVYLMHLQEAIKLSWRSSTKLLIHFGDAPAHGSKYHTPYVSDIYPAGDPSGKFIEVLSTSTVMSNVCTSHHPAV